MMITHPFGLQPIFRYLVLYTVYNPPKKKHKYNLALSWYDFTWFYGFGMVWIVLFFRELLNISYIVLWIFPCCRRNSEASLEFQKKHTTPDTLWWTYKKLLKMAIEIVDFPINSMVIFHGKMLVHQRVCVSTTFSREVMFEKTQEVFLLWFQVGTSTVGHGYDIWSGVLEKPVFQ